MIEPVRLHDSCTDLMVRERKVQEPGVVAPRGPTYLVSSPVRGRAVHPRLYSGNHSERGREHAAR